jgi:hypothetical protein
MWVGRLRYRMHQNPAVYLAGDGVSSWDHAASCSSDYMAMSCSWWWQAQLLTSAAPGHVARACHCLISPCTSCTCEPPATPAPCEGTILCFNLVLNQLSPHLIAAAAHS